MKSSLLELLMSQKIRSFKEKDGLLIKALTTEGVSFHIVGNIGITEA